MLCFANVVKAPVVKNILSDVDVLLNGIVVNQFPPLFNEYFTF